MTVQLFLAGVDGLVSLTNRLATAEFIEPLARRVDEKHEFNNTIIGPGDLPF